MREGQFDREYNDRLFAGGVYGSHHVARFVWLREQINALRLQRVRVLELGCFDAKTVDFIPGEIERYVGLDAGWESGRKGGKSFGLQAAIDRFAGDPRFSFRASVDPADLWDIDGEFDVGICTETFEHIEPRLVDSYIRGFSARLRGVLLVTVPNEKGIPLVVKTLSAKVLGVDRNIPYTVGEFLNCVVGRLDHVPQKDHKGFDFGVVASLLRKHFSEVNVAGVYPFLPPSLQLTVGMVARGASSSA